MPVGHGTLYLGMVRGFRQLAEAGAIEGVPAMFAVQPDAVGSLTDSAGGGELDVAPGVHIECPGREHELREAIDAVGGSVVTVSSAAIRTAHDDLLSAGFDACSTAAVGIAGHRRLQSEEAMPTRSSVVVPLTGRMRAH